MDIDTIIGECQRLAELYIEAMEGQGKEQAEGFTSGPCHAEARAAFDRLLSHTHVLEDNGRADLAERFIVGSQHAGSARSIKAQSAALAELAAT